MTESHPTSEQIKATIQRNEELLEQTRTTIAQARATAIDKSGMTPEEAHQKLNKAMDNDALPADISAAVREHREKLQRGNEDQRQAAHQQARSAGAHSGMRHRTV